MMEKKPTIIPYLTFNGECEEAVSAYIAAFGGEIFYMSRWDRNSSERPEQVGKVMHVEFALGGTRMSAGDNFDFAGENMPIRLMVHMDSMEEARHAVDTLAQGGRGGPVTTAPPPGPGRRGLRLHDPGQVRVSLDNHLSEPG